MRNLYYYLRPGVFSMVGFSYGKAEGGVNSDGKVKIRLVRSGRWTHETNQTAELQQNDIAARSVTRTQAMDGVGTFIGSAICTPRVPPEGVRIWDYGFGVGFKWTDSKQRGDFDVNFGNGVITSMEIYALHPCRGKNVSLIMPQELRQKHEDVYTMFNGVDRPAVRDPTVLLGLTGKGRFDETQLIPLLDITSFEVSHVTTRHVLDYVFYKEGGRPTPPGLTLGESIFDESADLLPLISPNERLATDSSTDLVLSDGLKDDDELPQTQLQQPSTKSAHKKRKIETEALPKANPVISIPVQPPRISTEAHFNDNIEQLIALQRSERPDHVAPQAVADTSQFQPTGTQSSIHLAFVNGKYASMSPQQFVEFVQIHWRKFGFFRTLLYCALFTVGILILEVYPWRILFEITEAEKRNSVRRFDMSNFSRKNALPSPTPVLVFAELMGALDVMSNIARQLYQPMVLEAFDAAATFLGELRVSDLPLSESTLAEITAWVDERLELFRVFVSEQNWPDATAIKNHFHASHESFVRVSQLILRQDIAAAIKASAVVSKAPSITVIKDGQQGHSKRRTRISNGIHKVLPKQDGKQICLGISQHKDAGNEKCIIDDLCHFKPAILPDIVREFIEKHYGGLSSDVK
ncbi:LOW QUALITY PROTEIN: hypothetical protein PHMEG_00013609 [Phytophthora megakarya]|uniref:Uncharacterized protein n=1 Tax=Phytophthora megakarya TaxID=4795 RepID=A0A225W5V2_9STRA|nr:LOW QUALITY PROTEIN: hypothetical protein PHMEG_00013609 [Phytophthora megakarya]